jgi:hypothetical protein
MLPRHVFSYSNCIGNASGSIAEAMTLVPFDQMSMDDQAKCLADLAA